jgi:hypothetical protein
MHYHELYFCINKVLILKYIYVLESYFNLHTLWYLEVSGLVYIVFETKLLDKLVDSYVM